MMIINDFSSGEPSVKLFTIQNSDGSLVKLTNFGARIVSIIVPDKNGVLTDVVMGYDTAEEYFHDRGSFGAVCGRYANRIGGGRFILDGTEYQLTQNNGNNTLHGGKVGFSAKIWDYSIEDENKITFTYTAADGEEGFPGEMEASVTYTFTNEHALKLEYGADTTRNTVVNLTNHSYFNLNGDPGISAEDHFLKINAEHFTPVDEGLIPTGELRALKNTPFDFTSFRQVGERINDDYDQLKIGGGYDHNFCLDSSTAAVMYSENSGITLTVETTMPGVQFYSGNFIRSMSGKGGKAYTRRGGLCLETQFFPDSPNHDNFPSATLKVGEHFSATTVFTFGIKKGL